MKESIGQKNMFDPQPMSPILSHSDPSHDAYIMVTKFSYIAFVSKPVDYFQAIKSQKNNPFTQRAGVDICLYACGPGQVFILAFFRATSYCLENVSLWFIVFL